MSQKSTNIDLTFTVHVNISKNCLLKPHFRMTSRQILTQKIFGGFEFLQWLDLSWKIFQLMLRFSLFCGIFW